MSCLGIALGILGCIAPLIGWVAFLKRDSFVSLPGEEALADWWQRKFPPREDRSSPRRGFDVVPPDSTKSDE